MLRTDSLTDSLPQKKGTDMAKKTTPAPDTPHHVAMGQSALSAMQHLGVTGMQQAVGDVSSFANVNAQHEDFTPRVYASKSTKQG